MNATNLSLRNMLLLSGLLFTGIIAPGDAAGQCTPPPVVSRKDSFRCGTGTVALEATTTAGNSIKWYASLTGGTALATGNNFTTPSISANTTYYIAASNGTCESTPRQAVIASVRTVPTVNIGNDTTICPGVSYVLNATTPNATYAWNTGAVTPTITVSGAGTYSVLVTVNGCGGSDARNITAGIVPVNNLPAVTNLCAGQTTSLNAGNTGSTFLWTPGGATTQFLTVTTGGTYNVAIKSANGCVINSSTALTIRPLPVPALGNDTSICKGVQLTLNAGNPGYSYLWHTSATTQSISASDSGTYAVKITTPYNCTLTDSMHIAYLPGPSTEGFNFVPLFFEELGKVKFTPLNPVAVNSYEWDFGDGTPKSTSVTPTHVYLGTGQFIVKLKVFNDCSTDSVSQPINVNLTTGITNQHPDAALVSVYPNPASDLLTISTPSDKIMMEEVAIFNILGAAVYRHKADAGRAHQVSVAHLSAGTYILRIYTAQGWITRKLDIRK